MVPNRGNQTHEVTVSGRQILRGLMWPGYAIATMAAEPPTPHIDMARPANGHTTPPNRNQAMSHLPQDLHDIFPDQADRLRALKDSDRHFRSLADRYAALDDEIRRSEIGVAPAMDDAHADALKRDRLAVLDQIAAVVNGDVTGEDA
jgi:uncharacterized protein